MMIPLRRALIVQQHRRVEISRKGRPAPKCSRRARAESRALSGSEAAGGQAGGAAIFGGFGVGLALQDGHVGFQSVEGHAGEDFWRAIYGRLDCGGNFPGTFGGRLCHRAAHFLPSWRRGVCCRIWC